MRGSATYDSAPETLAHIRRVQELLAQVMVELTDRLVDHDQTKLVEPEKSAFDECTPLLAQTAYGSPANDVKDALRRRHPAFELQLQGVGRWTCIEEWQKIDLLALDAWRSAEVIGYEVKVSRADMRTELLRPDKRRAAVAMCTRFYFAVPAGMLTDEERAYQQPEFADEDFKRACCEGVPGFGPLTWGRGRRDTPRFGGQCKGSYAKGRNRKMVQPYTIEVPVPRTFPPRPPRGTLEESDLRYYLASLERDFRMDYGSKGVERITCPACKGKGYIKTSRVELDAPTLWIPPDVGLVAVGAGGCSVIRESPRRKITEPIMPWPYVAGGSSKLTPENANRVQRQAINQLVRWASFRPDPRHRRTVS